MSENPIPSTDVSGCVIRFDDAVPVVQIPDDLDFEALRGWVRRCFPERVAELGGRACRLDIGERSIQLFDLRRLLHLMRDEFSVEVTGLYVRPDAIQRYAERELKLKLFPSEPTVGVVVPSPDDQDVVEDGDTEDRDDADPVLDAVTLPHDIESTDLVEVEPVLDEAVLDDLAAEAPRRNAPDQGSRTLTVHRTLRSGSVVRFDGDLIVFGDVNPGANLIATGNIVVLGALKGMAHAGALGDESKTILAFNFRPTQVRIGRKIAIPPEGFRSTPELVVVRAGEIVIETYKGRFR